METGCIRRSIRNASPRNPYCDFLSMEVFMTGRERVRAALNHVEPDKIPVDCGGMRSTGLLGVTYNRLKKYLNILWQRQ